jgi:hypothetical protein
MSMQGHNSMGMTIYGGSAVVAKNATTKDFLALRIMGNVQNLHVALVSRKSLAPEART